MIDRTGERFGRLTVIRQAARDHRGPAWECICDCGKTVKIPSRQFSGARAVKSCGCLQRESARATGASTTIDRSGQRVGRLLLIEKASTRIRGSIAYIAKCDCGAEIVRPGSDLIEGKTTSCGCLQAERASEANRKRTKHGHARQDETGTKRLTTPEYRTWKAMKERCRNENAPNYHLYGGRGISICDRWLGDNGFLNFLTDMGPRPEGMTLDRIYVDGDYEPANCKWSTAKEQAQNRRMTDARRESIMKWAQAGWDLAKANAKRA